MAYYFVCSAFPPLSLNTKPEMSFKEAREMLALNLSPGDLKQVDLLVRVIDLSNLRAFWLDLPAEEWDDKGNYGPKELEEILLLSERLPPYLLDFLEKYESTADRLHYFPSLFASFYREEKVKGFLKKYFEQEREIRLVLTALRSQMFGSDLSRELQFEDPQDPFVAQILAQKGAEEYLPPSEYEELKTIFRDTLSHPQRLHQAVLEFRLEKIEELEEMAPFTMDQVLGYMARLNLVEEWHHLDPAEGKMILEHLSENG